MARKLLIVLLLGTGITTALAIVPVFMPRAWMEAGHQALLHAPLPAGPVVEYLARTVSALYAGLGGLCLLAASDTRRHRALVTYLAGFFTAFGAIVWWVDATAGLPAWWTLGESLQTIGLGLALFVLHHFARKAPGEP